MLVKVRFVFIRLFFIRPLFIISHCAIIFLLVGTGSHSVDTALSQFPCLSFPVPDYRHPHRSWFLPCLLLSSHGPFLHDSQTWPASVISIPELTVSVNTEQRCEHACLWDHEHHIFYVCSEGPLRSGYIACCSMNQIRK